MQTELGFIYSSDNYKIVGYFTKSHCDPHELLKAAINYHAYPEWIEENISILDVSQEYWEISTNDDYDWEFDLEFYIKSNKSDGFPVTVFYLDNDYKVV